MCSTGKQVAQLADWAAVGVAVSLPWSKEVDHDGRIRNEVISSRARFFTTPGVCSWG
jgi:hypothetical protein